MPTNNEIIARLEGNRDITAVLYPAQGIRAEFEKLYIYNPDAGGASVHHDDTLKGSGTISDPLGISDEVMEEIENAGKVDDVRVDGVSVVTNKIAEIDLTGKVDKTSEADKVYGTDSEGEQTTYDVNSFGKIDNIEIHGITQPNVNKTVDLSVIEQMTALPAPSSTYDGRVVQYIGETTQTLTHNCFYECISRIEYTDATRVVRSASAQLVASANIETFLQSGLSTNTPYLYEKHGAYWDCIDPAGVTISGPRAGLVLGGVVNTNDQVILEVDSEQVNKWVAVNVQSYVGVEDVLVNGTSVVTNGVANVTVPTKTSDITNDSGFITKDVNDLTNYTKTEDLADVALTGDYGDLENTPTNVSDFTNDADYQNATQVSNTVSGAITTHNTSNNAHSNLLTPITQDIDAIEEKIPAEASSSNQLADKAYVDSQIGDIDEWTTEQYTPTTTNFVVGQTYTVEEAFQRTASLFAGQQGEIDDIEAVIPAQATTQNQLADKNFVNATVATNSANFRGNWATWTLVPTDANLYPEDYVGSRTPTNNDYMVVSDASDFAGGNIDVFTPDNYTVINEYWNLSDFLPVTPGTYVNYYYHRSYGASARAQIELYDQNKSRISTLDCQTTTGAGDYHDDFVIGNNIYYVKVQFLSNGRDSDIHVYTFATAGAYQGTWRFIYIGTWATDGKNGWNPVYQIGTAFTQEQQAAIDSGITANMVDNYVDPNSTAATAYNARITAVETDKRDIINSANKVYATDSLGANKNDLVYDKTATAETIAQRGTNGVLKVGTPVDNSDAATKKYVDDIAADKQDVIDDLSTIRSGASLGATSLQPGDNVSELTNDAGYTTNVGTVTSVNNTQPDANGNVNITTTGAAWGSITGTLSDQTDLQTALNKRIEQVTSLPLDDTWMNHIVQYVGPDYPLNDIYRGYFYIYETRPYAEHMSRTGWWQLNTQPLGAGAISDLTDVVLTNLTDGQVLVYNSSTNKWVNDDQHGGVTATYDATTKTITFA